jgi:tRNA pseudouridine(55) synthase
MASGALLLLLGDECKKQTEYHALDKQYEFSTVFGISSDTGDILGRLQYTAPPTVTVNNLHQTCRRLQGDVALAYPHFSSKTVQGKPLHVWTLEGRLDEIEIPIRHSHVYNLRLLKLESYTGEELYKRALKRIDQLPTVTAPSKALGEDFRRVAVLRDWAAFWTAHSQDEYPVATFTCTATSGTYMRSLAEQIAASNNTIGLAHHIHRTILGHYRHLYGRFGYWTTRYRP